MSRSHVHKKTHPEKYIHATVQLSETIIVPLLFFHNRKETKPTPPEHIASWWKLMNESNMSTISWTSSLGNHTDNNKPKRNIRKDNRLTSNASRKELNNAFRIFEAIIIKIKDEKRMRIDCKSYILTVITEPVKMFPENYLLFFEPVIDYVVMKTHFTQSKMHRKHYIM